MTLQPHRPGMLTAGLTALTAMVLALLPAAPAGAQAPDNAPPTIEDIGFSPAAVSVRGFDVRMVTVSVRLTDESGVVSNTSMPGETPLLEVARTAGGVRAPVFLLLKLASGTAQDGVWRATLPVPSTHHGSWQAVKLYAQDTVGNRLELDPRTIGIEDTLRVTGTHQPRLSFGLKPPVPRYGDPVRVQGRATYADTGAPIAGRVMRVGHDNMCAEPYFSLKIRTDARGYYGYTWPKADGYLLCVFFTVPENFGTDVSGVAFLAGRSVFPGLQYRLGARLTRTPIPLGSATTVTGNSAPSDGVGGARYVTLERLVSGSWRKAGQAYVRASGRFTLVAQPPSRGNHRYRVARYPDPGSNWAAARTPTLLLGVY